MNKLVFNEQTFEFKQWWFTPNNLSEPSYEIHCFVDGIKYDSLKVETYGSDRVIFKNKSFQTTSGFDGEFGFDCCVEYYLHFKKYEKELLKHSNK